MLSRKIVLLFPGQGSQYVGMGKDFSTQFATAKQTFEEADDILECNLSEIIFNGPLSLLTETQNAQNSIMTVSVAILRTLQKQLGLLEPYACLGLSLGEYSALHAAQKISFKECLTLVNHRAQYMDEACRSTQGTMAAVMGLNADVVDRVVSEIGMPNDIWIANYNSPGQTVISGTIRGVEIASRKLSEKGAKRVLPLQVHGAFHSGLMRSAREKLKPHILTTPFQNSSPFIIMNASAKPAESTQHIQLGLIEQITASVRWEQSICCMESYSPDLYIEIGCGKTLARLNKQIGVITPSISVDKVTDLVSLESTLESLPQK